jgi:hypothetical protein
MAVAALVMLAADPATDGASLLLAYGPLGVFAVLAIVAFRVIWKRLIELHAREMARADAAETAIRELQAKVIESYVPNVVRFVDAVADVLEQLRRERR